MRINQFFIAIYHFQISLNALFYYWKNDLPVCKVTEHSMASVGGKMPIELNVVAFRRILKA